ncbi:hypothetical protein Tco_1031878 [Tanacetum coccineum]|uniref:Uncharacterized protein n=1 Tax=Tanacetum coccineum TaxID=301880 RepID=A0ABQ5GCJ2_9ASTR
MIPRQRQSDPETLVLTTAQIDLDEATQMSIATAKSIEDFEAQQAVKKVEEHLIDEDIEKIMEGDEESDANKFVDDIEEREGYSGDSGYTPTTTPRSSMTHIDSLSSDMEELKELTASEPTSSSSKHKTSHSKHIRGKVVVLEMVDETTNDNMKKNLSMVVKEAIKLERESTKADIAAMVDDDVRKEQERTRATPSSQVSNDVATNIPPHMKDDKQACDADLPIWLAIKYKYEKSAPIVKPCRVDAFRNRYHEDHYDDDARPKGESNAKKAENV